MTVATSKITLLEKFPWTKNIGIMAGEKNQHQTTAFNVPTTQPTRTWSIVWYPTAIRHQDADIAESTTTTAVVKFHVSYLDFVFIAFIRYPIDKNDKDVAWEEGIPCPLLELPPGLGCRSRFLSALAIALFRTEPIAK